MPYINYHSTQHKTQEAPQLHLAETLAFLLMEFLYLITGMVSHGIMVQTLFVADQEILLAQVVHKQPKTGTGMLFQQK